MSNSKEFQRTDAAIRETRDVGVVSDIAAFVMKRDVKLQPANL